MIVNVENHFGGWSTLLKLGIVEKYLSAFTTALKKQHFELIYIDAFAGTGRCDLKINNQQISTDGSARRALDVKPCFDRFYFIEKNKKFVKALEKLRAEHAQKNIEILEGDANVKLKHICDQFSKNTRAVIFLDPFGCEIEWETLTAIAKTQAMDVWYLFSLMGLYRQSPHNAEKLTEDKTKTLTRILGTEDWQNAFYSSSKQLTIDEGVSSAQKRASYEEMLDFVSRRLRGIFLGGVSKPKILYRDQLQKGPAMHALYFAVANPSEKAKEPAFKIANHILKQDPQRALAYTLYNSDTHPTTLL